MTGEPLNARRAPFADRDGQIQIEAGPMRAIFALASMHSDSIVRPSCFECGTATQLVGIEAERPGYELHTFQPSVRAF